MTTGGHEADVAFFIKFRLLVKLVACFLDPSIIVAIKEVIVCKAEASNWNDAEVMPLEDKFSLCRLETQVQD